MKKLLLLVLPAMILLSSCKENDTKWEYKIVKISADNTDEYNSKDLVVNNSELNKYGNGGWELVSCYTETV